MQFIAPGECPDLLPESVWIALPAFLTYRGFDIKTVGLFSLAQAPWSFKFLWSPLMDRYGPRFGRMGRRRSWILVCQLFLLLTILALPFVAPVVTRPLAPLVGRTAASTAFALLVVAAAWLLARVMWRRGWFLKV